MKKIFGKIVIGVGAIFFILISLFIYFNIPVKNKIDKVDLGVTFSLRYAQDIGLDWRENYLAILDDLGVQKIRLPIYWDLVEEKEGEYNFSDIDWQIAEAEKRDVEIILVVGKKVPRWPECAIPEWVKSDKIKRETALIKFIKIVVERYKDSDTVKYWQVENEPFLAFGNCCEFDINLLEREIETVKQLDNTRQIIITDSGELSFWIRAAKRADVFGTTMYFNVCGERWGCYKYPIGPRFFLFKKWLIKKFAEQSNSIVIELQAEPWVNE